MFKKDIKNEVIHNKLNREVYGKLLLDVRWLDFRKKISERDNNKCVVCQSNINLHIHHKQYHFSELSRTYKKPWEYNDIYLITLCKRCHDKGHSKFKVPVKYIK
jgi:5-methylcytosine-specific restriction endonuclease McrA